VRSVAVERILIRILGRPWQWWATAPLEPAHYLTIWNSFRVYRHPFRNLYRYVFQRGGYPYVCELRTPIGDVSAELSSWHDMMTVNEIFCRLDYKAKPTVETVVDIGSNIGISALYFLTRNRTAHCYLVEPDPRNVARLRRNLEPFADRYTLDECAVADVAGMLEFGVEATGRYGGLGLDLPETIVVRCREINDLVGAVVASAGRIDILKVDTEGMEERTVKAIRPDLLREIDLIYLESIDPIEPLHPDSMQQTRRLATWRLAPRSSKR
jgi:FkbM family methyltransferase